MSGPGRCSQLVPRLARGVPKRTERTARRDRLGSGIREIFAQSKRRYGAPRIRAELKDPGFHISKRVVAKLMRENGIRPPRGRRRAPITTDSRHSHAIAPNLLDRNFEAAAPDAVWLADISCIPTDEGWLYLTAVKDLATMEIVGWSMSERLKSTLCEARATLFEYIEIFYNRQRCHSSIGYRTPAQARRDMTIAQAA